MNRRRPPIVVLLALAGLCALGCACSDADTDRNATDTPPQTPSPEPSAEIAATPQADRAAAAADAAEITPWPLPRSEMDSDDPGVWSIEVLDIRPHDPTAFTQGLEFYGGTLIESTGRYGESSVRIVDPLTGRTILQQELDSDLFGEGLTRYGDIVIQLTWLSGTALRWQLPDLHPLAPLSYDGEGWGICAMGDTVITSDGSSTVSRRDPTSFEVVASAEATLRGEPVAYLNELECIDGLVVANVWHSDHLMVFDPDDGGVVAEIDASGLGGHVERPDDPEAVLNGVADLGDGTLLLTGKLWPSSAVVRLTAG